MPTLTTTVESVQKVEATSKKTGKPYTKYVVHAGGLEFATFDGALANAVHMTMVGKPTELVYEDGQFGKDLKGAKPADSFVPPPDQAGAIHAAPPAASHGDSDWDLIGLRKTRCVLWVALLGPAMEYGFERLVPPGGDVEAFVHRFGTQLRQIAEADIYGDKQPAGPDDWIPF